jgi:hypothetical protein
MAQPLMPKATAVWLVENTTLTFKQIADFCGLHELEVQAIADGEVAGGMQGLDPIGNGQLLKEEVARGEADPNYSLQLAKPNIPLPEPRSKGARYTPVAKRSDRPDAIAWLLKSHPELSDAQITRLVGTTKHTIQAVRNRTHWNTPNIKPQSPVLLGLCSHDELDKALERARERARRALEEAGTKGKGKGRSQTVDIIAPATPESALEAAEESGAIAEEDKPVAEEQSVAEVGGEPAATHEPS